jgi:pyruvate,water dikinase
MGLPPESLDFLTRGATFTKPPLQGTIRNLAGLLRLLGRELNLSHNFCTDYRHYFKPTLREISKISAKELGDKELLSRVETLFSVLKKATYYSILSPLSFALRQKILQVNEKVLDHSKTSEIESMRSLAFLATETRKLIPEDHITFDCCASLFAYLSEIPEGQNILAQFDNWLEDYGYLGQVATDIAVPRWKDDPRPVREIFAQFILQHSGYTQIVKNIAKKNWKTHLVQKRLNLKATVTTIYSQLLAHLRWTFLALAQQWVDNKLLERPEDIFYLKLEEIRSLVGDINSIINLAELIQKRKFSLEQDGEITTVPLLIYGKPSESSMIPTLSPLSPSQILRGIGSSEGIIEGKIRVLTNLQTIGSIDKNTILVVPYTDSGWTVVLSRAGGIIAEVGGRLSHGAIIAREYGIPSVMDVHNATQILKNGQTVRLNGQLGTVEILETIDPHTSHLSQE